ncbi:MAG: SAM-dependent chlorinase/fluorinase [Blastocatellia bacterium]
MITLLTDFGTADYFIPAVKGVIASLSPRTRVVDLTHEIPAQDIAAAAFTLGVCYRNFPAGTVHLAVVDPGVGSARRAIVVAAGEQYFVGPDNGIFSLVFAHETDCRVFHATDTAYFRPSISPTFHGRDVFAPLAAWLAKGIAPDGFGPEVHDYVRLVWARPQLTDGTLQGEILHVDYFGNCITNFTAAELRLAEVTATTCFRIGGREVQRFATHFAAATANELLAYLGSAGYWEIALSQASAAQQLAVARRSGVTLIL